MGKGAFGSFGRRRNRVRLGGLALGIAVLVAYPSAGRAEDDVQSTWSDAGLGMGTGLLNLVYIPTKLVYATLGSVTGGLAYALTLGSTDTAMQVWEPTVGGSYVLTPEMLTGDEEIRFTGGPPAQG